MKSIMFVQAQCIMKSIAPTCRRLLLLPGMSSTPQHYTISKTQMLRRKLSLGVKIIQVGGIERMYRRAFKTILESERVLKASQCYLWTTSGPIAGLLFVSTERLAFCSDKTIKCSSTKGDLMGMSYYKVSIPIEKITRAAQSECARREKTEKCVQVVTSDEFQFWFAGIVGFKETFKSLQQVVTSQGCGLI